MSLMAGKQRLINKLREIGYAYKRTHKNNQFYRKRGGDHRDALILVPRKGTVDVEFAKQCLEQAGCHEQEIEAFLQELRSTQSNPDT